jgi:hypothetical protein
LPTGASDAEIDRLCQEHSARLFDWIEDRKKAHQADGLLPVITIYDGTIGSACRIYQEHPDSDFHTVKHSTRDTYLVSLRLIIKTIGTRVVKNCTIVDCKRWYREWRKPAIIGRDGAGAAIFGAERIDRAHDGIAMLRTVLRFMAALRKKDCHQLVEELKLVTFERRGSRELEMTYAMARDFIRTAGELGAKGAIPADRARYLAIGVASQFEFGVRQLDIIGDYHPMVPAPKLRADIPQIRIGTKIWAGYYTWENIPGWRWRTRTSKSKYKSPAEFDLTKYDLLMPLLEAVPHDERKGPIVKGEGGLPILRAQYSRWFRRIADAAGIPKEVWNRDARPGAATEAENAGVPIELIRDSLNHTRTETTVSYIRRRGSKKNDLVADAKRELRKTAGDDGGTA